MSLKQHFSSHALPVITLSALLCSPYAAMAASQSETISGWSWSAHVSNLNIDSEVAQNQYVDDSTFVLGAAAERFTNDSDFTLSFGLDVLFLKDQAGFTNLTTDGEKSSSASGGMLFAEYGPKLPFGENDEHFFDVRGGYSISLGASRSISYCSGCDSEDIDIEGGAYGILGVGHTFTSFDLSLQYQQYFSGDLDNSLRLKISTSF